MGNSLINSSTISLLLINRLTSTTDLNNSAYATPNGLTMFTSRSVCTERVLVPSTTPWCFTLGRSKWVRDLKTQLGTINITFYQLNSWRFQNVAAAQMDLPLYNHQQTNPKFFRGFGPTINSASRAESNDTTRTSVVQDGEGWINNDCAKNQQLVASHWWLP